jgi:protoporphyrinogen/coproporphyrinogen III oxidase
MRERRIVIVGGGITGLAAADAAATRAHETGRAVSLTVVEGSGRFGGSVVTERVDGFLLDGGPDSWVASKPHATALARDLGLAPVLIGTNEATRRYYIARGDRLYPVPEGLVLGVPTRLMPLALTSLFSWRGKARMALEPLVPARRFEGDDDESIAAFAARRLGREAADRLVGPLLGGISAGDAGQVSARAAFPQLVAMEREHGSLVRGMRAAKRSRAPGPQPSAFLSLEGGTGALVDALLLRLRRGHVELRSGIGARRLARADGGWLVELDSGESIGADAVLLAVPAHASARLVADLPGDLAGALSAVRYVSTATVFLAYRAADVPHRLDGVGFVVPPALGRPVLAATWVSSKWSGRAPEGHVLLRAFLGGAGREGVLARDDAALAALAAEDLGRWMTLAGRPLWSRVFRFDAARPQMLVGHLATMRRIRERLALAAPGVRLAAGGFDGDGIPDCIRQGQAAGREMVDERSTVFFADAFAMPASARLRRT